MFQGIALQQMARMALGFAAALCLFFNAGLLLDGDRDFLASLCVKPLRHARDMTWNLVGELQRVGTVSSGKEDSISQSASKESSDRESYQTMTSLDSPSSSHALPLRPKLFQNIIDKIVF